VIPMPLRMLGAAPHRLMFAGGMLTGLAAMLWWLADLGGRYLGLYGTPAWPVAAAWIHAHLFIFCFFPFFMFGFLMTAMPNWLGDVAVKRGACVASGVMQFAGVVVLLGGLWLGAGVALAGALLQLAGFGIGILELVRFNAASRNQDNLYPRFIVFSLIVGWIAACGFVAVLAGADAAFGSASRSIGLWCFLVPVFFSVTHRMLPFFSSRVLADYVIVRPRWSLPALLGLFWLHGAIELGGFPAWLWLADLPALSIAGYLAVIWGIGRCFEARLLAVLHVSLLGLVVALLLSTLQSVGQLSRGEFVLGAAPLHALTIGYFSAMTLAMVSRVSLGHSGRALFADTLTWSCFVGVVAAGMMRVTAEFSAVGAAGAAPALTLMAGVLWLASYLAWTARYLPMYFTVRVDGKPG
jgi:uncharacterized protein involved in response to NO